MRNPAEYFLVSKFEMRNKGAAVPVLDRRDAVTATLRGSRRKATYRTLIDLLAVTDMRIGDAIGINRNDFDANCGVLTIRDGKFGKSRGLPLHRVRSPLMSSEMEVASRSSRTRTTVPSSGLLLRVQTIRRQWHDSPPHRPSASRGIACQGISGKGVLAQSVALEAAVCQSGRDHLHDVGVVRKVKRRARHEMPRDAV
jgi:integrase